jgi:riboflavin biosynthesis pyrimidine reductase
VTATERSSLARFAELVADKTRAAEAAAIPPYETDCDDPLPGMVSIGSEWTRRLFGGAFYLSPADDPRRPSCSLVFVRSADGNTGARNPASLGGGVADAHLIYEGLSRVAADAVMVGAETIRGSGQVLSVWHPELVRLRTSLGLPRHPVQIVATLQGVDLDETLLFNVPELPVILITVAGCAARFQRAIRRRPWITEVVMSSPHEIERAFARLRELGVKRLSCIGGRRLAGTLLDAKLVDESYLTTAPRPGGEPHTPLSPAAHDGRVVVRKRGTGADAGVVFEHIVLRGEAGGCPNPAAQPPGR